MDPARRELFNRLLICWLRNVHAKHGCIFSLGGVVALRMRRRRLTDVSSSSNCRLSYGYVFMNYSYTILKVKVPLADQGRYQNRKGEITTNVLGVCSQGGQFTFILPGWEGSAENSRVLGDSIISKHGLKVPQGQYYLVGSWFTSCEGFLAPYKAKRYRKNQMREEHYPGILHECFNSRHSLAMNVIKRSFGMLKLRWAIPRDLPFSKGVQMYNLIIIACCLLPNMILQDGEDPLEDELVDMEAEIFNETIRKKRKYMNLVWIG